MSDYGVTETGFVVKPLLQIVTDIETLIHDDLSPVEDTDPERPLGQLIGIFSGELAECWEGLAQCYRSTDPDGAEDDALDNVCAITGTIREDAQFSSVTITLTLEAAVTVQEGSVVSLDGDDTVRFATTEDVTSTSAGDYPVLVRAEDSGPIAAPAGTLTNIVTPVVGWTAVTNASDAELGAVVQNNDALRTQREIELRAQGSGSVAALRAKVLVCDPLIEDVRVIENTTNATVDGVPAKHFEVVLYDGGGLVNNNVIAQAINDNRSAGTPSHGSEEGTAVDPHGDDVVEKFTRATVVEVDFEADIVVSDLTKFPGVASVETALRAFAESSQTISKDFVVLAYAAIVQQTPGVDRLSDYGCRINADPFAKDNIDITSRQKAALGTVTLTVV